MPSILTIVVDSIPSTSSATLALGTVKFNIDDLLQLHVKMRERSNTQKLWHQRPSKIFLLQKKIRKLLEQQKEKNLMLKAIARSRNQGKIRQIRPKGTYLLQDLNTSSKSDISLDQICDDDEDEDLNKCLVPMWRIWSQQWSSIQMHFLYLIGTH